MLVTITLILLIGLKGNYSVFSFKYRPTNNFEETGLKHYDCELFSPIVHYSFDSLIPMVFLDFVFFFAFLVYLGRFE